MSGEQISSAEVNGREQDAERIVRDAMRDPQLRDLVGPDPGGDPALAYWEAVAFLKGKDLEPHTGSPDLIAGFKLFDEVVRFVRRFVVITDTQATAVVLWIVHTHCFQAAEATPYLSITSAEKQSGKTRLLEVLELLVAKPWHTGKVTAAVLARKVDAERPTLLLDESDAAFKGEKEYAEALRGLLNTGYREGGKSSICVGNGAKMDYKDFSTFGPKAIAGIGNLPDTVADRAIPIRLKRKRQDEPADRFRRRRVQSESEPLRERLELWGQGSADVLADVEPDVPPELSDRAADCWEPLLAIADRAGGDWPVRARQAAVELSANGEAEDASIGVRLLADIREAFGDRDRFATAQLLEALHAMEESPWSEWFGKPLTPRALAKLLKPHAIGPRSVWMPDTGTAKGYLREQFEDVWSRHLPETRSDPAGPAEPALEAGSAPISYPAGDPHLPDCETGANPHGERDLTDLPDTGRQDGDSA
jgi:hypothetical protein